MSNMEKMGGVGRLITRRNVIHRATKYVTYAKNASVERLIRGKPL